MIELDDQYCFWLTMDLMLPRYVNVRYLLPNTTSVYQPLDAGIISVFKRRYCHRMLEYAISAIKLQQPPWSFNILQAIRWCDDTGLGLDLERLLLGLWRILSL